MMKLIIFILSFLALCAANAQVVVSYNNRELELDEMEIKKEIA